MEQGKKSAITKCKILDAAEAEFAQNGLAAARVDAIAAAAGVNKQLIYAHFQSKENLYSVILRQAYAKLNEYEAAITNENYSCVEDIRKIILEYFDFLMHNPSFVRLMLWENLNGAVYLSGVENNLFSGVEQVLKRGVKDGWLRSDLDIAQTAMSMNMFCFSAFSNVHTISKITGKDLTKKDELENRAQHIADVLIKYVLYGEGTVVC